MNLHAAVYARKSTEQSVSEDAKSVTRQVDLARAFATEQGWTVDAAHVYVDDAASGGAFNDKDRPAFYQLLAAAPQHHFGAVVLMDESRLGRDQYRTAYALQCLTDADVQVWYYQDRRHAELTTATGKFMESVKSYAAEVEREKARARARESGRHKVANGHSAGGKVLGYVSVQDGSHMRRMVDAAQADIVRRIFTLCAEGKGFTRTAHALNEAGILNPTGQARIGSVKSGTFWASTGIRDILYRDLYRGRVVYGRTRWEDKDGRPVKVNVTDEAKWIVQERPELRIVSEELWTAAHARIAATHTAYGYRTGGRLNGRPASGLESKYLLAGLLRCTVCGGMMQASKLCSTRGRPRVVYACSTHRRRGTAACPEQHTLRATAIHEAVTVSLRKVLTPEHLDALLTTWAEARPDHEAKRQPLQDDLARVDAELKRLGDAVAGGAVVQTLLDGITAREAERRGLLAQLEHLDGLAKAAAGFESETQLAELRSILTDWSKALTVAGPVGRQYLRSLLRGPVDVTRQPDGVWRFEGRGTLGNLFKGWLGIRFSDAEVGAMNDQADELNAEAAQAVESAGVSVAFPEPKDHLYNRRDREAGGSRLTGLGRRPSQ